MTRSQLARLARCLGVAGAAVPILGVGHAAASDLAAVADLTAERASNLTGPQVPAAAPTAGPTPEIPDTLGPTTDDEDEDGLGGGAAAGLGVAAAALVAGGVLLRRFGRN